MELKVSMTESMAVLRFSEDGHYLYGGSGTGMRGLIARNGVHVGNAEWNIA